MSATPVAGRIISRRAQALLKKHAPERFPTPPPKAKSSKTDDTSWPKSVRYTFYTVCAASVPFSIGTAISLSPKLREWMAGDGAPTGDDDASGFSGRKLIRVVRQYWGTEDDIPSVDKPAAGYISPGSRKVWQEDNYSSFLHFLGLDAKTQGTENLGGEVPLSLENEPPANIRHDQELLDKFLSPIANPEGVKTRLTLLPCTDDEDVENAGYDTECTLPANVSLDTLRQMCKGSDAQYTRKVLADSWPDFRLVSSNERLRTGSWSKDCRWVVSFTDDEESEEVDNSGGNMDDLVADIVVYGDKGVEAMGASESPSDDNNSELLRKSTSIHSSWSYFPELANGAAPGPASSALGASMGAGGRSPSTQTKQQQPSMSLSNADLRIQQLQHQITTLKQELNDPNSFRDRDGMYEELKQAKRELRSLKPWWRKIV